MILSIFCLLVLLFCGLDALAFSFHPRLHSSSLVDSSFPSTRVSSSQRPCSYLRMVSFKTATAGTNPSLLIALREKLGNSDDSLAQLVLASQSPRRREILDMMGLAGRYTVEPSPLDESVLQAELVKAKIPSIEYTKRLAESKAESLARKHLSDNEQQQQLPIYYLGSDTIVELDECILEKPKDTSEAKQMLGRLSGREHHVHTGVAIYRLHQSELTLVSSFTDTAAVSFTNLNDDDIEAYVASGEPMDKAGTYVVLCVFLHAI